MKLYLKIPFILFILLSLQTAKAQTNIRSYIFGHSLIDHRPPLIPTPSDETTIPHWMYLLATEAGHTYGCTGQYGFLPQHDDLPPSSNWGYDIVPAVWDSEIEPFSDADFNNILITAGNFIQWQAPNLPYPNLGGVTPLSATYDIIDWVTQEEPGTKVYIYENWPDMAPYLSNGIFPPTSSDLTNYYNYINGDFHDWWIEYHDSLLLSHPNVEVKMIPIGPILAELFTNTVLDQIPATELYEDDAPHGRATTYFLASLITYMATYEEQAPPTYVVPTIVHEIVRNNYSTIVNHIWDELSDFNLPNGESRVFFISPLPVELTSFEGKFENEGVELSWATSSEKDNEKFEIEYSLDGENFHTIGTVGGAGTTSTPQQYNYRHNDGLAIINYYRLKQINFNGSFEYSDVIVVEIKKDENIFLSFFPNPSASGIMTLEYFSANDSELEISVFAASGKIIYQEKRYLESGENQMFFDFGRMGKGVFIVRLFDGEEFTFKKIMIE